MGQCEKANLTRGMCEHQVQEGGPEAGRGMPMPDPCELSSDGAQALGKQEHIAEKVANGGDRAARMECSNCQDPGILFVRLSLIAFISCP